MCLQISRWTGSLGPARPEHPGCVVRPAENRVLVTDILHRIDGLAVTQNLKMHVRPGRATG